MSSKVIPMSSLRQESHWQEEAVVAGGEAVVAGGEAVVAGVANRQQ